MKKSIITLLTIWFLAKCFAGPIVTKTASTTNAYIGDQITYTIEVCGITNTNQLNSIVDNLGLNLEYLGTDILSSPISSVYAIGCSGTVPNVSLSSANVLTIQFPNCNIGMPASCFKFEIYTKIKDTACFSEGKKISNTITVNPTSMASWSSVTSLPCEVNVNSGVPWTLIKNYKKYLANTLYYDIRLNAAYGGYNSQVLFNDLSVGQMFCDTVFLDTCMQADALNSTVFWTKDDGSGGSLGTATGLSMTYNAAGHFLVLKWDLPAVSSTSNKTLNSYLFTVKIKLINCTCTSATPFDIKNKVFFNALNKCNKPVKLAALATIPSAKCNVFSGDTACFTKEVIMNGNNLGLTMPGCKGKYIITIKNCSDYIKYAHINFTDNAPAGIQFGTPIGMPAACFIPAPTPSSISFQSTSALNPGGVIVITIPFLVTSTVAPNSIVKNCVTIKIKAVNTLTFTSFPIVKTVCASIKTIPTQVTNFLEKKLCTDVKHTCGPFTSNEFMPNDTLTYMLHFYNYGTAAGKNVVLKDNLPANFTIVNPSTDIKVYSVMANTWAVNNNCSPAGATLLTSAMPSYNSTTNAVKVNFGSNLLVPFTCNGIRHYFVKIKVKISSAAPNGLYNNAFQISYDTMQNIAPHSWINGTNNSNIVSVVVNSDNLILIKPKSVIKNSQSCDKQTDTVTYELLYGNMSQVPIMFNLKDQISLPAGVSLATGIHNLKYCKFSNPSISCIPTTSFTSGVTINPTGFVAINQMLQPCEVITIRYSVVYNTAGLPPGAASGKNVCNNAIFEAGYPVSIWSHMDWTNPMSISLAKNPDLIENYLSANTTENRYEAIQSINSESGLNRKSAELNLKSKIKFISDNPISLYPNLYTFTPIIRDTSTYCYWLTSCLNGISNACFNSTQKSGATFKINNIDLSGVASTTLTFTGTAMVSKVEYVLTDIRMIRTCPSSPPWMVSICRPCTQNLIGFSYVTPLSPLGGLPLTSLPIAFPFGAYNELNKTVFSSTTPVSMSGPFNKNYQLPITSLNCGGRLEFVITVIITYKDCSVCYLSDAFKYNATRQFVFTPLNQDFNNKMNQK